MSLGSDPAAVAEPFQLEDFGDHRFHLDHIGGDAAALVAFGEEGEGDFDAGERRAELVADVEQELVAGTEHVRDAADHLVESVGQGAELVARVARHGDVEMPFAQAGDSFVQRPHGTEGTAQGEVGGGDDPATKSRSSWTIRVCALPMLRPTSQATR